MAPRQPPAVAWYSSALDLPNVSEASLSQLRWMATARGVNGAKVFKAGSATPEEALHHPPREAWTLARVLSLG